MSKRNNRIAVLLAVGLAVALGVAVLPDSAGPPREASAGRTRPGTRIDLYLGQHLPLADIQRLDKVAWEAEAACLEALGLSEARNEFVPDAGLLAAEELRGNDPLLFEQQHHYGVAVEVEGSMQRAVVSASEPIASTSDADVDVLSKCSAEGASAVQKYLAPSEVHFRYQQLLYSSASDDRFVAASASWAKCMESNGFVVSSVFDGRGIVAQRAFELANNTSQEVPEGSEVALVLSDEGLEDLRRFEAEVYDADSGCADESGLWDVMYELESQILAQLHREFPSFTGVAAS